MRSRLEKAMLRPASTREILLVLGIPLALSLASAIMWRRRHPASMVFTDRNLLFSLAVQAILAACLLPYLYRRRWTPVAVAGIPKLRVFARRLGLSLGLLGLFYLPVLALVRVAAVFVP